MRERNLPAERLDWRVTGPTSVQRTCVGCRRRCDSVELVRIVAADQGDGFVARVDSRGRLPGRGAWLHPDPECFHRAERHRAFPRALRLSGPLDLSDVRKAIDESVATK